MLCAKVIYINKKTEKEKITLQSLSDIIINVGVILFIILLIQNFIVATITLSYTTDSIYTNFIILTITTVISVLLLLSLFIIYNALFSKKVI